MSALATIVGSLGELSESELRQLYLMVGVRLGIPDVPPGESPRSQARGKSSNARPSTVKNRKKATSSKGNPMRKSQWANHPLYIEYSRLKKVVEAQAKEMRTSFNGVDTAESRAYRLAFNQWLEAKSSFRDHGESGQGRVSTRERKEEEEESSEEEEVEATSSRIQAKPGSPPTAHAGVGKSNSSPAKPLPGQSWSARGQSKSPSK